VADQAAFLPGFGEVGAVDLVTVGRAQQDGEVIVAVWESQTLYQGGTDEKTYRSGGCC